MIFQPVIPDERKHQLVVVLFQNRPNNEQLGARAKFQHRGQLLDKKQWILAGTNAPDKDKNDIIWCYSVGGARLDSIAPWVRRNSYAERRQVGLARRNNRYVF